MKNEATPEQIAMARRIAAHALCGPEKWKPGVKAGMFEDIMRGYADDESLVQTALAAIIETTEAAAKLVEASDGYNDVTGAIIARALRNNNHLKGQSHD